MELIFFSNSVAVKPFSGTYADHISPSFLSSMHWDTHGLTALYTSVMKITGVKNWGRRRSRLLFLGVWVIARLRPNWN